MSDLLRAGPCKRIVADFAGNVIPITAMPLFPDYSIPVFQGTEASHTTCYDLASANRQTKGREN